MEYIQDQKKVNRTILLFACCYMVSYITRINFGAVILGTILYKFVDFKPRISKMKLKLQKQEKEELKESYCG